MQGLCKPVAPGICGIKPLAGSTVQAQVQAVQLFRKPHLMPHGRKPAQGALVLGKDLPCRLKPPPHGPRKGGLCLVNLLHQLCPRGPQQLCRVRGRCRAQVCGHVGKGNVHFMPNTRQHRQARLIHRLGHGFFIKSPQIFQRTAAAHQHNNLRPALRVGFVYGPHNGRGRLCALHQGREQPNACPAATAGRQLHKVMDGRARG